MGSSCPLLKEEQYADEDLDSIDEATTRQPILLRRTTWISRIFYSPFTLHLLVAVGYTIYFIWLARSRPNTGCTQSELIYCKNAQNSKTSIAQGLTIIFVTAPAKEALDYEKKVFYSPVDGNPFAGPPRPELDAAWHNLLKSIRTISKKDIRLEVQ